MIDIVKDLGEDEISEYYQLSSNEAKRLFLQSVISKNFKYLVYLLGYRDLGKFHEKEVNEIGRVREVNDNESIRRLYLWSRGFFKTSIITISHSIYLIINNPRIKILLVSNTLEISKKILAEIKGHFIQNEDFRYIFKEFCPKENKEGKIEWGTTESFTIPNRHKVIKEPTMMVAGVGTNLTGLHFSYMKIDDLVTKDSVTNDTQIMASKDYYASLRQLFDNPSFPKEDVVGTTYHFNDLYSDILKTEEFGKSIIPVHDKNENYIFPERIDKDGFERILNDPSIGPHVASSQYLMNPINPKDVKFKEEWLTFYDKIDDNNILKEYICVDPASTQKKKSDYTVIEHWGVNNLGHHLLLNALRDKISSPERINALFDLVKLTKKLMWVKYEVLGGRHGDMEHIKNEQINRQIFFEIKETKSSTASKTDRIEQRLVAPYHAGVVFLPKHLYYKSKYDGKIHDFITELKLEFLQFPFCEHDDILDCQSQMFEEPVSIIKGTVNKIEKKDGITADDWDCFYKSIDAEQKRNPFLNKQQIQKKLFTRKIRRLINT